MPYENVKDLWKSYIGETPPRNTVSSVILDDQKDMATKRSELAALVNWLARPEGVANGGDLATRLWKLLNEELDGLEPFTEAEGLILDQQYKEWETDKNKTNYAVDLPEGSILPGVGQGAVTVTPGADGTLYVDAHPRVFKSDWSQWRYKHGKADSWQDYSQGVHPAPVIGRDEVDGFGYIVSLDPEPKFGQRRPDEPKYWNSNLTGWMYKDELTQSTNWRPKEGEPTLGVDMFLQGSKGGAQWEYITEVAVSGGRTKAKTSPKYDPEAHGAIKLNSRDISAEVIKKQQLLASVIAYSHVSTMLKNALVLDRAARGALKPLANTPGVTQVGPEFSVKEAKSAQGKALLDIAELAKKSADDFLAPYSPDFIEKTVVNMGDAVRYTLKVQQENFGVIAQGILDGLAEAGWKTSDHVVDLGDGKFQEYKGGGFKQFFAKPSPTGYFGINAKFWVPLQVDGRVEERLIELQIHSITSYLAKEKGTHGLKEQARINQVDAEKIRNQSGNEAVKSWQIGDKLATAQFYNDKQKAVFDFLGVAKPSDSKDVVWNEKKSDEVGSSDADASSSRPKEGN